MNSRSQRKILIMNLGIAAIVISVTMFALDAGGGYEDAGKGVVTFGEVYNNILQNYVKEIDPTKITEKAIEGMMDDLDPYSMYMPPTDLTQLEEDAQGEFGGLGIEIATIDEYTRVMSPPLPDTPAERVGLRAGDVIIEIDGTSTHEMKISDVVSRLRGKINTRVTIKVVRGAADEPMTFDITRARIMLHNTSYAGEIVSDVGYIKLNRFNQDAATEVRDALNDILKNGNLKGVILDLRSNPGGLLTAARDIADEFLLDKSLIVSTIGRDPQNKFEMLARRRPSINPSMPLVVMINERSASASEIVAAAIQDHDRGVLVGTTSFGKGLVQTVLDMPNNAGLKLTTAYYYSPSGRCIHNDRNLDMDYIALQVNGGEIDPEMAEEDSLVIRDEYYTLNLERVVYGGGGVTPDLIVKDESVGHLVRQMLYQSVFFNYAIKFAESHPDLSEDFQITDEIVASFREFTNTEADFEYSIPGETNLETFRTAVEREDYNGDITTMIDALEAAVAAERETDFDKYTETIKRILKREIASTSFGSAARTIASKEWDEQLRTAIEVLTIPGRYGTLMSVGAETGVVVGENTEDQ
jgi:carboxyl-terminal processing protease